MPSHVLYKKNDYIFNYFKRFILLFTTFFYYKENYCFIISVWKHLFQVIFFHKAQGMNRKLDSIDLHILKELQADGNITNVELARRVGLSAPPCLRRVRALEEDGVIKSYRVILEPRALGFEIVSFAMVQLVTQGKPELTAFLQAVLSMKEVRQCWTLSGETDFMLYCVSENLASFQEFVSKLTALSNVRNVRTALCLEQNKDSPLISFENLPE